MTPLTHRDSGPREGGQVTAEYIGLIAVLVAVILAVALTAPDIGGVIQAAICRAFGGTCAAPVDLAKPTEPCTVSAHNVEANVGVTIFSVDAGRGGKWSMTENSDHTYEVAVEGGVNIGARFGDGGGAKLSLGKLQKYLGEEGQATIDAIGKTGSSWKFDSQSAAQDFYITATHDAAKQAATQALSISPGTGDPITHGILMWGLNKIDGRSFDPPTPDESFREGGVKGHAEGNYGLGAGSLGADGSLAVVVGEKDVNKGSDKGAKTYYFKVNLDVALKASAGLEGTPLQGAATGKGAFEGVISLSYDPSGKPKEMKFEGTPEGSIAMGLGSEQKGKEAKAVLDSLKKLASASSDAVGKKRIVTMSVDLSNPSNLAASADLLHALKVPALKGQGSAHPSASDSISFLYDQFRNPAGGTHLSWTIYDTSAKNYGADVSGADGIEFGGRADFSSTDERLSSASYYSPGRGFVPWKECVSQ